jgi:hypothetical protein
MRSCGPPRSDGRAEGAQTAAGDGELVGEEATIEVVIMPEAIAVSLSFEQVLDVAAGTTVLRVGSDGNGGGGGGTRHRAEAGGRERSRVKNGPAWS